MAMSDDRQVVRGDILFWVVEREDDASHMYSLQSVGDRAEFVRNCPGKNRGEYHIWLAQVVTG